MGFFDRWRRPPEQRSSYTDLVVAGLAAQASGTAADSSTLAVVEIAAHYYSKSFAVASVTPSGPAASALNPSILAAIARALVRSGESLHVIDVVQGRLRLLPCCDWDIVGSADPASWTYTATLAGPSGTVTRRVSGAGVIHCRFAEDPDQPWKGVSPLRKAATTSAVASNLETRLSQELSGQSGHLLPVPGDPSAPQFTGLKTDLASLKGRTAMVPALSGQFELGAGNQSPRHEWKQIRYGPSPPPELDIIRTTTGRQLLAALGIPLGMVDPGAESAALRESLRQFLHTSISPLGSLVSTELATKLDQPDLALDFVRLSAADIMGKARAYNSFTAAGMDAGLAQRLVGVETPA